MKIFIALLCITSAALAKPPKPPVVDCENGLDVFGGKLKEIEPDSKDITMEELKWLLKSVKDEDVGHFMEQLNAAMECGMQLCEEFESAMTNFDGDKKDLMMALRPFMEKDNCGWGKLMKHADGMMYKMAIAGTRLSPEAIGDMQNECPAGDFSGKKLDLDALLGIFNKMEKLEELIEIGTYYTASHLAARKEDFECYEKVFGTITNETDANTIASVLLEAQKAFKNNSRIIAETLEEIASRVDDHIPAFTPNLMTLAIWHKIAFICNEFNWKMYELSARYTFRHINDDHKEARSISDQAMAKIRSFKYKFDL